MQWFLNKKVEVINKQFKLQEQMGYSEETGTNRPTIVQVNLKQKTEDFINNHNISNWDSYWENFKNNIAGTAFKQIYKSWSENKLEEVRFLLSTRLYKSFEFWINMYKSNDYKNKLENIEINYLDLAKIDLDKFYDSITVRVYASCFDYIENKNGALVSGSKNNLRWFSEYWTFIRKA